MPVKIYPKVTNTAWMA